MPYEQNVCCICFKGEYDLHKPLGELIIMYPAVVGMASTTFRVRMCRKHLDVITKYCNLQIPKYPPKAISPDQMRIEKYET